MKSMIIVALCMVAYVAAAPPQEPIKIIRSEFDTQPEGGYVFSYETENGIVRSENGELKSVVDEENKPHSVVIVRGSYTYPDENGHPITISYYADESGYHAEGDSVPKAVSRR